MADGTIRWGGSDPGKDRIVFSILGKEILRLEMSGDIYVRGRLTTNDLEVVEGMRDFIRAARPPEP